MGYPWDDRWWGGLLSIQDNMLFSVGEVTANPFKWQGTHLSQQISVCPAGACEVQNRRLYEDQKRQLLLLSFGQVPKTRDEQHQLGQKQQTFRVESPSGEMQLGMQSVSIWQEIRKSLCCSSSLLTTGSSDIGLYTGRVRTFGNRRTPSRL